MAAAVLPAAQSQRGEPVSGVLEAAPGSIEPGAQDHATGRRYPHAAEPRVVSVERGYELWAQSYDQEPNPLLALEERLLEPILPDLKGSRVLDLACGTGRWLNKFLLRGARLGIGIDCSPAMIANARRKPLLHGRLIRGDCLALPLPSAVADFVMCSFAIGHFPEVESLAAEIARVTSPQAAVYVSDMHPDAYREGWRTGFRSNGQAVEITTFHHSLTDVHQTFEAQGLELTQCIEGKLEEPEKPSFERAGRLDRFCQYKGWPAIFINRFSRLNS